MTHTPYEAASPFRSQVEREVGALQDKEWKFVQEECFPAYLRGEPVSEIGRRIRKSREAFGPDPSKSEEPLRFVRGSKKSRGEKSSTVRQEAISILVAQIAAQDDSVASFRSDELKDHLLKWSEIQTWIATKAKAEGRHSIWVQTPVPADSIRIVAGLPRLQRRVRPTGKPPDLNPYLKFLDYAPAEDPAIRQVPIAAGGTLDHLRMISESLARKYGWQPAAATVFVLAGITPWIDPITTRVTLRTPLGSLSRIQLTIDPAISVSEVVKVYRRVRRQILGQRHRAMTDKHMQLAQFTSTAKTPLRKQMMVWNQRFPQWRYSDVRNFDRDCKAATRRLLNRDITFQGQLAGTTAEP